MEYEAGSELDTLIVERFFGGVTADPDAGSETNEPRYYLHGSRHMLRGIAYELEPGYYQRSWDKWSPSMDTAAAWQVVEHFYQVRINHRKDGEYEVGFWTNLYSGSRVGKAETFPLAVCRAALLWQ